MNAARARWSGAFGELWQLLRLGAPSAFAQAGFALMGLVDTAVVGRAGTIPLAAVGLANGLFICVAIFGIGLTLGSDPLISQAFGGGDPRRARQLYWQGSWLAIATSVALALPLALIAFSAERLGVEDALAREARLYLLWRLPGLVPTLMFVAARAYLQTIGRTRQLVVSTIVANIVNFFADVWFVFGGADLPVWTGPMRAVPALGAAGAAMATSLSAGVQLAILVWTITRATTPGTAGLDTTGLRRPRPDDLRRAARIGMPIGLQMAAEFAVFAIAAVLAARMGSADLGAHQIGMSFSTLAFCVAGGMGSAAAIRVGLAVGARDTRAARRSGLIAFAAVLFLTAAAAVAFITFPAPVARLITNQPEVVAAVTTLLVAVAAFQIADGVQGVGAGVLRGIGDSRFILYANVGGHYAVGIPVAVLLAVVFQQGVNGIWWGLTAGYAAVGAALLARFWILSSRPIRPLVDPPAVVAPLDSDAV